VLTTSQLFSVPFYVMLFLGQSHGLGTSIEGAGDDMVDQGIQVRRTCLLSDRHMLKHTQMFYWYQIPRLVSMGLAKTSGAFLVHEVSDGAKCRPKPLNLFIICATALWTVIAPSIAIFELTSDDAHAKVNPISMEQQVQR
jgi:hypothetical protein